MCAYDSNYGRQGNFDQPLNPQPRIGLANLWPVPTRQPDPSLVVPPYPMPGPWPIGAVGGGGPYGQVQDGTGNQYSVVLYSDGPNNPSDNGGTPITVTILGPPLTKDIVAGTWIGPVDTTTDSSGTTYGWCIASTISSTQGTLYGVVQSGSGDTYIVQTYSNGPTKPADVKPVTVTILQIALTENIPDGTWIGPIDTVSNADGTISGWCQVPIWLP